jgi:ribonuclease HI
MSSTKPHFLLFCEGSAAASGESGKSQRGRWRFVLENVETGQKTEATDVEPGSPVDRCALISILRGLESLEQPSRVTLVTTNRYVTRGLQYGLAEWRGNDFSWERFGTIQPIRNDDLWRRIDRTLAFHQVQCRWMSQDEVETDDGMIEAVGLAPTSCEPSSQHARSESAHNVPGWSSTPSEESSVAVLTSNRRSRVVASVSTTTDSRSHSHAEGQATTTVRSELTTRLPQRVFVDTPVPSGRSIATYIEPRTDENIPPRKASQQPFSTPALNRIFSPFRAAWRALIATDEWLETYLRCLLLMDPRASSTKLSSSQSVQGPKPDNTKSNPVDSSTDTQNYPFSL